MQVSITTTLTLSNAEITEAIEQYIQANGVDLNGKDIGFKSGLPVEVIVTVTEKPKDINQHANQNLIEHGKAIVDSSELEDTYTPPEIDLVTQKPKGWNPFSDQPNSHIRGAVPITKHDNCKIDNWEPKAQEVLPEPIVLRPRHLMFK